MATTDHSAGGQALGYLHQTQVALLELLRRQRREPDLRVRLEKLDDIELNLGVDAKEALQVKHGVKPGALTDKSEQVWKTLAVWMDLQAGVGLAQIGLTLMTTATAMDGEGVSFLRSTGRDESKAEELLRVAAGDSESESTDKVRKRFLALGNLERKELLAAVVVADSQPSATDFEAELRDEVRLLAPVGREAEFAGALTGWWYARAALMLARQLDAVSVAELHAFLDDLRDELGRANLRVDEQFEDEPDDYEVEALLTRTFITQLKIVAATSELLDLAVRDYWRAYAQRGRWTRAGDIAEEELTRYERRLREEWRQAHAMMRARLGPGSSEIAQRRAGLALCDDLPQRATARLRRDFQEPVITRGTLHGLADLRRIGWHPEFEANLARVIGPLEDPA